MSVYRYKIEICVFMMIKIIRFYHALKKLIPKGSEGREC